METWEATMCHSKLVELVYSWTSGRLPCGIHTDDVVGLEGTTWHGKYSGNHLAHSMKFTWCHVDQLWASMRKHQIGHVVLTKKLGLSDFDPPTSPIIIQ